MDQMQAGMKVRTLVISSNQLVCAVIRGMVLAAGKQVKATSPLTLWFCKPNS
jgi:hypothetical protein